MENGQAGAAQSTTGDFFTWRGGPGQIQVDGTFDGATVTLQRQAISNPASGVSIGDSTTLTADGHGNFNMAGCRLRVAITGAGGSTSLSYRVSSLPQTV